MLKSIRRWKPRERLSFVKSYRRFHLAIRYVVRDVPVAVFIKETCVLVSNARSNGQALILKQTQIHEHLRLEESLTNTSIQYSITRAYGQAHTGRVNLCLGVSPICTPEKIPVSNHSIRGQRNSYITVEGRRIMSTS